jgi:hypothetical protein
MVVRLLQSLIGIHIFDEEVESLLENMRSALKRD